MTQGYHQSAFSRARIGAAFALIAAVSFAPALALAAGNAAAHEDKTEMRIKTMHAKLNITAAQEPQWNKVAEVMREDAKNMDSLTQARMDHAKDVSAVDDLKSYGDVAQAHADGIKKLVPVFSDLYASMTDAQKKEADYLFQHGNNKHGHKSMSKG